MNSIGIALFCGVVQVLLLACAAELPYRFARRKRPDLAAFVALATFIGSTLLTLSAFSPWPQWSAGPVAVAGPDPAEPLVSAAATTSTAVLHDGRAERPGDRWPSSQTQRNPSSFPVFFQIPAMLAAAAAEESWGWPSWFAAAFAACSSFGLLRLLIGLHGVCALARNSRRIDAPALRETTDVLQAELECRTSVDLRESKDVNPAATFGLFHPQILLAPRWAEWPESQLHAVLAHELAHIRRNDCLAWLVAQMGLVIQFINPLLHIWARRFNLQQELAADCEASRLVAGHQNYLKLLTDLVLCQVDPPIAACAHLFIPRRGTFLSRVEILRDWKQPRAQASRRSRLACAAILITTAALASGWRVPAPSGTANGSVEASHSSNAEIPRFVTLSAIGEEVRAYPLAMVAEDIVDAEADGDYDDSASADVRGWQLPPLGQLSLRARIDRTEDVDAFRILVDRPGPVAITVVPLTPGFRVMVRLTWPGAAGREADTDGSRESRWGRAFNLIRDVLPKPDNWIHVNIENNLNSGPEPVGRYLLVVRQPRSHDDSEPDEMGIDAIPLLLDASGAGPLRDEPLPAISYAGDRDFFQLLAPRTGRLAVRVDSVDRRFQPQLRLYDAQGHAVGDSLRPASTSRNAKGTAAATCAATAENIYFLEVSTENEAAPRGSATGAYKVSVGDGGR